MKLSEQYKLWQEQYDAELRCEAQLVVVARQFERKLRRPLTEGERDTLRFRLAAQREALGDVVLDLDAPALEAWLAAPDAH